MVWGCSSNFKCSTTWRHHVCMQAKMNRLTEWWMASCLIYYLHLTLVPPVHSSFFQSLCILGYCVFPLDIAALVNLLIGLAFKSLLIKSLIVGIGFVWATRGEWVMKCPVMSESVYLPLPLNAFLLVCPSCPVQPQLQSSLSAKWSVRNEKCWLCILSSSFTPFWHGWSSYNKRIPHPSDVKEKTRVNTFLYH